MNSTECIVMASSWVALIALFIIISLASYLTIRELSSAIMARGLFPRALAPACIIAARLHCTKGDKTRTIAFTVMQEIARAEKNCPGFTQHIEELFPRRHKLHD